jgi:hypothetical protein
MYYKYNRPNLISLSAAPANIVIGKQYYDLLASIEFMNYMQQKDIIDGFEFQLLEEWNENLPPIDEREKRLVAWHNSPKYSIDNIIALIKESGANILSVHAKRDIGIYLCSSNSSDIEEGKRLINETLYFTNQIGGCLCIFHLWDTWKEEINIQFLYETLLKISSKYPTVKASVENVPTHMKGCTPFELVKQFQWITLDLQWAALYNELEKFTEVKDKIVNVHLRGKLEQSRWVLKGSPFEFYEAIKKIREKWEYKGILTMEPNELKAGELNEFISAMSSLNAG